MRLFRRFTSDPRPYRFGVALLVLEAVTAVVEPIPIAFLIDFLQGARPTMRELGGPTLLDSERIETILLLTLAIVMIAAINSAADSLTEVCMARGGRSLGYSIRIAMYSHLQRLPLAYHDTKRTGDVLTRVTGDVLVVEDFVVKSVSNILGSLMVLTGSFVFLLTQSWNVALVAIVVIPVLALVSNHYSRRIKVASRAQRDHEGELASTAQEMLTSIRLVQSYGRGTVDLEQFSGQTEKSMQASLTAANIQARFSFVIALVEALSISAVVWLGVWLVDQQAITVGTLVLFVLLLQNMFKPARKIVSEWYKIGKVFASVERIEDLLDREIVVRDRPDAVPAPALEGRLTFRHVGFTYPAEREDGSEPALRPPVLFDIDFGIEPGEVVALVGMSGAGKSTIAQLVPRLYDADHGEVLVDGLRVQDLTLGSLRSQISLVLQDTVLLSGTVAENIGYGIADATPRDVVEAAKLANAHEFISALPEGYDTRLGERGSTLSGGQRQRIAIARAFIRRTPILILDEPTTGLDAESARTVVDALRTLMQGRTTIVISHDVNLIRCAHRVLVVEAGRIVESGEHEHLADAGGAYAELFAAQALSLEDAAHHDVARASHEPDAEAQFRRPRPHAASPGSTAPDSLVEGLQRRLPGLAQALDAGFATQQVQLLLSDDAEVQDTTVGKLWLRGDGTCTLRYTPRLRAETDAPSIGPLLARLHPDDASAASYLGHRVQTLRRPRGFPPPPWRVSTAVATGTGLALHPFPFDPELPTLVRAVDPGSVLRMLAGGGLAGLPSVDVVHYPREGACVLRYHFPGDVGDAPTPATYYAKVYGNGVGEVTHHVLTSLDGGDAPPEGTTTRFPRAVAYSPPGRLLVTEALPGSALVPRLLTGAPDGPTWSERRSCALRAAVRASGEALATMHAQTRPRARVHTAPEELAGLDRDMQVVSEVWPEIAERVRRHVDALAVPTSERGGFVLSHGDFTPSQVLLGADQVAVVDLDTLCWAEPALDIGRYLAHLRLRVAACTGDPAAPLADELGAEFLSGYGVAAAEAAAGPGGHRLAFYTGTTLARTALHACRRLKAARLATALDLLGAVASHDRRVHP